MEQSEIESEETHDPTAYTTVLAMSNTVVSFKNLQPLCFTKLISPYFWNHGCNNRNGANVNYKTNN